MSVEVLSGDQGAVLFCNTTDWGFGPVFRSREHAEDFCAWLRTYPDKPEPLMAMFDGTDPRDFSDVGLERLYTRWLSERLDDEGELIETAEPEQPTHVFTSPVSGESRQVRIVGSEPADSDYDYRVEDEQGYRFPVAAEWLEKVEQPARQIRWEARPGERWPSPVASEEGA